MSKAGTLALVSLIVIVVVVAPGRSAGQEPRVDGRSLTEWAADLRDPLPAVRMRAVAALGRMGPPAIPPLLNLVLTDPHPPSPAARQAAQVLAGMGRAAAPLLIQALNDPDPVVRRRATYVLALFPDVDADVVSALGRVLADPERPVRINAALRLRQAGAAARPAASGLIAALHDDDSIVRTHASRALMQIAVVDPAVIPGLVDGLRSKHPSTARHALIMLGAPASQALVTALADPQTGVRQHAAAVLGKIRPVLSGVTSALIASLERDPDRDVRGQAVAALQDIGGTSDDVLFALVRALAVGDEIIREKSARALGAFNRPEPAVLNGLVHALKDPGWGVREAAAHALAGMAPPDPHVTQALVESLRDEYRPAMAAVDALARIGRPAAASLRHAAQDANESVRWRAEEALRLRARLDPTNVSAVLTMLLDREGDGRLRSRAADDVVRLGPQAQRAVPDLVRMLGDKDDEARRALAAHALAQILPKDRNTIVALTRSLSDSNAWVRVYAALALARIGPPAEARATLEKFATDPATEYLSVPGFTFELQRALGAVARSTP
jgi:HEAT repeat protein